MAVKFDFNCATAEDFRARRDEYMTGHLLPALQAAGFEAEPYTAYPAGVRVRATETKFVYFGVDVNRVAHYSYMSKPPACTTARARLTSGNPKTGEKLRCGVDNIERAVAFCTEAVADVRRAEAAASERQSIRDKLLALMQAAVAAWPMVGGVDVATDTRYGYSVDLLNAPRTSRLATLKFYASEDGFWLSSIDFNPSLDANVALPRLLALVGGVA